MKNKSEFIAKDAELVSSLYGKDSLLDGEIQRFDIFQIDWKVNIDVYVSMRSTSRFGLLMLCFSGCKEYEFYWADDYIFYNIERVKFFQNEDGFFYASFAPYDESKVILEEDQNFILSSSVSAYQIKAKEYRSQALHLTKSTKRGQS